MVVVLLLGLVVLGELPLLLLLERESRPRAELGTRPRVDQDISSRHQ